MSLSNFIRSLATIASLALVVPQATAQHEIHRGRPYIDPDGNNPDLWQPFVDPTAFPHDYQFFAPAEFGEFGNGPDPSTGWFGTYDRVYIYMSRPNSKPPTTEPIPPNASATQGDFTWGNRFEVGYMSPEDHGWFGEYWHIDGPNYFEVTEAERVNVIQTADQINSDNGGIDLRGGGTIGTPPTAGQAPPQNQGYPRSDQNNPISQDRRYFIRDSVNVANLGSFELNKSFRLKKFHYGSYFEPFFGFRYIQYQDYWEEDQYDRINDLGVVIGQVPPLTVDPEDLQNERFRRDINTFTNNMVGGQVGGRWYKTKGRWNLSSEIRAFMFSNFQFQQRVQTEELTFYGATGVDEPPEGVFLQNQFASASATELVYGGEVRAEAAFEVTRDFSLRGGFTFMEFGRGIGRGNDINNNSQDVTMYGLTFGFDYKR